MKASANPERKSSWETIKGWFRRTPLTPEAERVMEGAQGPKELLEGLDALITRNELAVRGIHKEIEALESVEKAEQERIRSRELPERSRNNVLRRIQRLRTQMDGLEERLRIYNRNIQLQVQLIGRVQALDAMQLRGVDEETIEHILTSYEEQLDLYRDVLGLDEVTDHELRSAWDDSEELAQLESEILGDSASKAAEPSVAQRVEAGTTVKEEPEQNADRPASAASQRRTSAVASASNAEALAFAAGPSAETEEVGERPRSESSASERSAS